MKQSYGWIAVEAADVRASYPEAVARIEAEAVAAFLESPETRGRLAVVLHKFPPYSDNSAFLQERAKHILEEMRKPAVEGGE